MSKRSILAEITAERDYQDREWGHSTDDRLDMAQWAGLITEYAQGVTDRTWRTNRRDRMIKVAALAVACLESMDRKKTF